jgi:hypothetical protein
VLAFAPPPAMVSRARRYGVSCLAKAHSRRMLQQVMEKPAKPPRPSGKRTISLEVHVMFEPSRLAQQCLQDAYTCLIPTARRRLRQASSANTSAHNRAERKVQ